MDISVYDIVERIGLSWLCQSKDGSKWVVKSEWGGVKKSLEFDNEEEARFFFHHQF